MADELLPKFASASKHYKGDNNIYSSISMPGLEPMPVPLSYGPGRRRTPSCTPLFKTQVILYDGVGGVWQVQYDGWKFKGKAKDQRHFRLTCGWRSLVRDKDIQIGRFAATAV